MRFTIFFLLAALFLSTPAKAEFYFHPQAGAVIPLKGGDTSYSLGITAGYQWNRYFATEASYLRLLGTGNAGNGDLIKGEGVIDLPGEWVTPYVSGGAGMLHTSLSGKDAWDPMILVGAGVTLSPVRFLSLGVGVSYAAVKNQPDFIQPVISVGLSL